MDAAAEDLAELPRIEPDIGGIGAVDRRLDNDRRRAVTRARRAALDEAPHVFGKTRHVERPMLHADIDVIRPDMRVFAALRIGQHVAAMAAGVVDRLILLQQLDSPVDALRHGFPSLQGSEKYPMPGRACPHDAPVDRGWPTDAAQLLGGDNYSIRTAFCKLGVAIAEMIIDTNWADFLDLMRHVGQAAEGERDLKRIIITPNETLTNTKTLHFD